MLVDKPEVLRRNPILFGKGVPAVLTVKAALVAALALVILIVLLPSGENDRLALAISIDGAIGPAAASSAWRGCG